MAHHMGAPIKPRHHKSARVIPQKNKQNNKREQPDDFYLP